MSHGLVEQGAKSVAGIARGVSRGETSAADVCRGALEAIRRHDGTLHAFLEVFADAAMARARAIDAMPASERASLALAGVPIAVKDNICVSPEDGGGRTTCASRLLKTYQSPFTATAVHRLLAAGAVIVGKTNMDEFGMGSSGENSGFGATRNPWDESRVPGGSSSGSAAATAAGMCACALGSDTGGSIRQPAGWCNLVGLKPTYGRVSRWGLVAYASSLDQIGPLARSVEDCARVAQVMMGHDPLDATSAQVDVPDLVSELHTPVMPLRIGVPRQARSSANHAGVTLALDEAIRVFSGMGAEIVDIDFAHADHAIAAYYIVACAEASSNLARFDGVRYGTRATLGSNDTLADLYARSRAEGLGAEVQRRIMLGTHVLSAGYADQYYVTALKARRLIKADFDQALAACDAILMPSSPGPAFVRGQRSGDPVSMYLEDVYTVGVNLAGLPGVTVPGGFVRENGQGGRDLPIGLQLVGPALGEARLLRIARMLESATRFGERSALNSE